LGNDPGARRLKREMASLPGAIIMPNAASGEPNSFADLGLALNRDGTFRLDSERLNETLDASPEAASAMFTTGLYGIFATFDSLARETGTASDPGTLGGSVARYTSQSKTIAEQLSVIADQQETLRARLTTTFSRSDRQVSASQSTLSFLQAQIELWNAN